MNKKDLLISPPYPANLPLTWHLNTLILQRLDSITQQLKRKDESVLIGGEVEIMTPAIAAHPDTIALDRREAISTFEASIATAGAADQAVLREQLQVLQGLTDREFLIYMLEKELPDILQVKDVRNAKKGDGSGYYGNAHSEKLEIHFIETSPENFIANYHRLLRCLEEKEQKYGFKISQFGRHLTFSMSRQGVNVMDRRENPERYLRDVGLINEGIANVLHNGAMCLFPEAIHHSLLPEIDVSPNKGSLIRVCSNRGELRNDSDRKNEHIALSVLLLVAGMHYGLHGQKPSEEHASPSDPYHVSKRVDLPQFRSGSDTFDALVTTLRGIHLDDNGHLVPNDYWMSRRTDRLHAELTGEHHPTDPMAMHLQERKIQQDREAISQFLRQTRIRQDGDTWKIDWPAHKFIPDSVREQIGQTISCTGLLPSVIVPPYKQNISRGRDAVPHSPEVRITRMINSSTLRDTLGDDLLNDIATAYNLPLQGRRLPVRQEVPTLWG